jgi:TonB family protein
MKMTVAVIAFVAFMQLTIHTVYAQGTEWETLTKESQELYRTGNYQHALVLAEKALEVAEKAVGPNHPSVATSLNILAALHYAQGRYVQAEPLYKRSLAIREKILGPDHPEVAATLNNLAALYQTQGKYVQAEPLYKRSLAIREKSLGPDHPDVAESRNNLATLLRKTGRANEKVSQENALSVEPPSTLDYRSYLDLIRSKVSSTWKYPTGVLGKHAVKLRFVLDIDGNLLSDEVVNSTDARLNSSVLEAMNRASPFPPIPEELKKLAGEPMIITFSLTTKPKDTP